MIKVNFRMDASAYVLGDPDDEDIEMAIIERIESMMQAVREGGMELCQCMEIYEPFEIHPKCPHCGKELTPSGLGQYAYQCEDCDEDFFRVECNEE